MKKVCSIIVLCLCVVLLKAAPTITIQNVNADEDIAAYMQEELKNQLVNFPDKEIKIKLIQDGNALFVAFYIEKDNIEGHENSSDVWKELDALISRVSGSIRQKVMAATPAPTPVQKSTPAPARTQTPTKSTPVVTTAPVASAKTEKVIAEPQKNTGVTYANGIGELMTFSDGSKGVVFYKTSDGHGLVVSLYSTKAKWENVSRSRDCHDVPALPNQDGSSYLSYRQGEQNTDVIIRTLGAVQAPAAAWCVQQGAGWYLPSDGELWYLLFEANGQACEEGLVSLALRQAGGYPLSSGWYWSSSENDKDEAININCSGRWMSSEEKHNVLLVRAIRAF